KDELLDELESKNIHVVSNETLSNYSDAMDDIMQAFMEIVDDVEDRKSTRLNSSHVSISYAVFCLKKKKNKQGGCCRSGSQVDKNYDRKERHNLLENRRTQAEYAPQVCDSYSALDLDIVPNDAMLD